MLNKHTFSLIFSALVLASCATPPEKIHSTYTSPLLYQNLDCLQLQAEATRVSSRVSELSGIQKKQVSGDAVATGVALVIFWPAVFLVGGDKETAAELGRLKGEMDAIESISIQKKCGIVFQHEDPKKSKKQTESMKQ